MWYFIIVVSAIFLGLFIWVYGDYKKQKKEPGKEEKSTFRTEDDLEEYGKPLKDEESKTVDFDDAE